jgi:hypothetical protein
VLKEEHLGRAGLVGEPGLCLLALFSSEGGSSRRRRRAGERPDRDPHKSPAL